MHIFENLIEILAFLIGLFGGCIIIVGVWQSAKIYIRQSCDKFFQKSRLALSQHLLLGLDFLVAKDVLDTLALKTDTFVLINLVVLVGLRILLTHFVNKEVQELKTEQQKISKPKTAQKKNQKPKIIA